MRHMGWHSAITRKNQSDNWDLGRRTGEWTETIGDLEGELGIGIMQTWEGRVGI